MVRFQLWMSYFPKYLAESVLVFSPTHLSIDPILALELSLDPGINAVDTIVRTYLSNLWKYPYERDADHNSQAQYLR